MAERPSQRQPAMNLAIFYVFAQAFSTSCMRVRGIPLVFYLVMDRVLTVEAAVGLFLASATAVVAPLSLPVFLLERDYSCLEEG